MLALTWLPFWILEPQSLAAAYPSCAKMDVWEDKDSNDLELCKKNQF